MKLFSRNTQDYTPVKVGTISVNPTGPAGTHDPTDPHAIGHVSKGGSFLCGVQYCFNYKASGRQGTAYNSGMDHTVFDVLKMRSEVSIKRFFTFRNPNSLSDE